jgi:very-short-patch-repair endonuclease
VFHHFGGGKYKGRINIEEAQKVAEAALEFMAAEPDKSLGIVTLNQAQRDVLLEEIERLVPREQAAQKYVEHWEDTLEPFFVKNLENVQGDERDVIFISTVYGPDAATGVVMNRFGPINGIYGHRRLNVLFTRAKDRVEVFTSMKPADIKPDEKSRLGVHVLKAYLEYAETGNIEAGTVTVREADSEFEQLVGDRLREKGFEVVPQVGVAGYFIDLAVKHPKRSGFVLGIECDGAGYHSSRSARDRDRLRQQVLERLQWNIYRIWSTDWFQNPEEQLGRLLRHLDTLLRNDL